MAAGAGAGRGGGEGGELNLCLKVGVMHMRTSTAAMQFSVVFVVHTNSHNAITAKCTSLPPSPSLPCARLNTCIGTKNYAVFVLLVSAGKYVWGSGVSVSP
jgi:hypothetical protein